MEDNLDTITSHLFTLRVWLEALGDGQSEWRGEIRYVRTGATYYIREWAQLQEGLRQCLPGFELVLTGTSGEGADIVK